MIKIFITGIVLCIYTACRNGIGEGLSMMIPTLIMVVAVWVNRGMQRISDNIEQEDLQLEMKALQDSLKRELEWYEIAEYNRAQNYSLN